MYQRSEHDEVFIRAVNFDRIDFPARTVAIGKEFQVVMNEMRENRLALIQHSIITMSDCNGVILVIHGRKIVE